MESNGGFSEGRALSVRMAGWRHGNDISVDPDAVYGRAEPAPPRRGPREVTCLTGQGREWCVRGGFLGGTRSARPRCKAERMPGHFIYRQGVGRGTGGPMGMASRSNRVPFAGVQSPPLHNDVRSTERALRGESWYDPKGWFSWRDALCASAV